MIQGLVASERAALFPPLRQTRTLSQWCWPCASQIPLDRIASSALAVAVVVVFWYLDGWAGLLLKEYVLFDAS